MRESPLSARLIERSSNFIHRLPGANSEEIVTMRNDALARLAFTGFPQIRDEQWKYTNIRPLERIEFEFSSDVDVSFNEMELDAINANSADVYRVVLVDGWFNENLSQLDGLPECISICSLAKILESNEKLDPRIRSFPIEQLKHKASKADNGFAALSSGIAADGVAVRLNAGATLDKPLEILCVSRDDASARICNINNFIHVEKQAKLQIIERYVSLADTNHLTNSAITCQLEDESVLDHYRIQNESQSAFHVGSATVNQATASRYRIYSLSFGALLNRHEVAQSLNGEQSYCELKGLYIGQGRQHIDNYTTVSHASPNGTSNEFYKGILDDRARAVFHGRITVEPGSQRTDAQQQNRNLLLSPDAEADTKPQLEIYADDVKCSHGATVGQLDEGAVFYLRTRGLGEHEAKAVLTKAFASEIVDEIEIVPLREQVAQLVQNKLESCFETREAA